MAILSVKNLSFQFKKNAPFFFKDLTFSCQPHKIHFIRGKNGAGKSTLFRLLQGKVYAGEIVSGECIVQDKHYVLNNIGAQHMLSQQASFVHQKFDLMLADKLSFQRNLQLANLMQFPGLQPLPTSQVLPPFIDRFGIDVDKPVYLLSGGQRQILAIMMALQKKASVLLLDEPTAALDEQNADMVMSFLAHLVQTAGILILIICHDKELVDRYAGNQYLELVIEKNSDLRVIRTIG